MSALEVSRGAVGWIRGLSLAALVAGCDGAGPIGTPPPPATEGILIVSNTTTGGAFDPDGYEVTVDGSRLGIMEVNDALDAAELTAGAHTVLVSGLAANCTMGGDPVQEVEVTGGSVTDLEIYVSCARLPDLGSVRILFVRSEEGEGTWMDGGAGNPGFLAWMDAGGGGPFPLAWGRGFLDPDVSPDGSRIIYLSDPGPQYGDPEIRVFDLEGEWDARIHPGPAYGPRWSPDGREIAYVGRPGGEWGGTLTVMAADGRNRLWLAGSDEVSEDADPSWSPDGTRIAFTHNEDPWAAGNHLSVWVVGRDGTGARRLTEENGGAHPVWSPVGDKIAFTSYARGWPDGIHVMKSDGTGAARILETGRLSNVRPWDWSPDGQLLLFTKQTGPDRTDIFLLRPEDGAVVRLTADGAWNSSPTFWW